MVASGTVPRGVVRCELPTQSVFTQKAAPRVADERTTNKDARVWDGGLLLSNSDGGGEICSWLSQPLKIAGYRNLIE